MKKNNILIIIIALFGLTVGCEETVDLEPTDIVVGDASSINTLESARLLLNGSYASLISNQVGIADIGADNARRAPTNTGQGVFVHNWAYNEQGSIGSFVGQYRALRDVNIVLDVIDGIEIVSSQEAERDRIKAEAHAVRAMAHFTLARQFSPRYDASSEYGIPLQLTPISASQLPSRASLGATYEQIMSDLETSISLFGNDNTVSQLDFFSRPSALALAAKVSLTMRNYEDALSYANQSIAAAPTDIATISQYPLVWRDQSNAGLLLTKLRSATGYEAAYNRVTNADIFYFGSNQIFEMYNDNDVRKSFNFDVLAEGDYKMTKWPDVNTIPAIDGKTIRVAEMYLTVAEAAAQLNQLEAAATAINKIRQNRISDYNDITYSSRDAALQDIYMERRLELAFEGDRMYQLKRLGMSVDRDSRDCVTSPCLLEANSFLFTFPISNTEISANPNITQFPGY